MRDAAAARPVWIHSPGLDLPLLILSPLVGVAMVLSQVATGKMWAPLAVSYLVGIPHYLSTLTFYMGDDNRGHYRARWPAFFMGPLLIVAAVLSLRLAGIHAPVLAAIFVWNIFHVARQSAGILSIYRRLNRGPECERIPAHRAILAVNATMAVWNIEAFAPLNDAFVAIHASIPGLLRAAGVVASLVTLAQLGLARRKRTEPISFPEGAFLLTSLLLFHPYLWVEDSGLATLGMLTGHFFQYLAMVWLVHRRKYGVHPGGSAAQRLLGRISSHGTVLLGAIVASGLLLYAFTKVTEAMGANMAYIIVWNTMVLIHFYLDGLIWAFRNPFVRASLGPYVGPVTARELAP
jgi:hypothetical protein